MGEPEEFLPVGFAQLALGEVGRGRRLGAAPIGGEDAALEEVGRAFVDRVLEIAEEPIGGVAFLGHADEFVQGEDLDAAFDGHPWHEPKRDVGDDAEHPITADREAEEVGILGARAMARNGIGADESERFDVTDDGWKTETAAVDVGGEGTTKGESVGTRLFLADSPCGICGRRLECGAAGDEGGPFDASIGGNQAVGGVEVANGGMAAEVEQPRVGAELLSAHGVAAAAD